MSNKGVIIAVVVVVLVVGYGVAQVVPLQNIKQSFANFIGSTSKGQTNSVTQNGQTSNNSASLTASTSGAASPVCAKSICVSNPQLQSDDSLVVDVTNNGTSPTETIQALDACAPGFSQCRDIACPQPTTFVLPVGDEFKNESLNLQCASSLFSEPYYYAYGSSPVAGQSYYFELGVTTNSGSSVVLNVAAPAIGSFTGSSTTSSFSVTDVVSSKVMLFENLSGNMDVVLDIAGSPSTNGLPSSNITASLYDEQVPINW